MYLSTDVLKYKVLLPGSGLYRPVKKKELSICHCFIFCHRPLDIEVGGNLPVDPQSSVGD